MAMVVLDGTVGAGQREAVSNLRRDAALRTRYEDQHQVSFRE